MSEQNQKQPYFSQEPEIVLEIGKTDHFDIERAGTEAYEAHKKAVNEDLLRGKAPYPISRRLEGEHSYVANLPVLTVSGKNGESLVRDLTFIDAIDMLIDKRKQSEGEYIPPVVLDIGPGNYQALLDAREKWGSDVTLVGLGQDDFMDFSGFKSLHSKETVQPTRERVEAENIVHIDASVTALKKSIPEELRPDVILANQSLQYIDVPLWETIKEQIFPTLREGGYMFLAFGEPHISMGYSALAETLKHYAITDVHRALNQRYKDDLERLDIFLKSKGFEADVNNNGTMAVHKVDVQGGYDLPDGVSTILHPTIEDVELVAPGRELADYAAAPYWQSALDEIRPRVYSAYPIMNIP